MTESAPAIDLYIIRHGETDLNLNRGIIAGRSNHAELNQAGSGQARHRGDQFRQDGIYPDMVFASPATRCLQTAGFCLEAMGCSQELIVDDRLQEASQGIWEGRPRPSVYTDVMIGQVHREGKNFRAPGGDSVNDVARRKLAFINELPSRFNDDANPKTVFVFGHGFATRILAGTLLDWSMHDMRREITPNASTSLFTYRHEDGWRVKNVGELVIAEA